MGGDVEDARPLHLLDRGFTSLGSQQGAHAQEPRHRIELADQGSQMGFCAAEPRPSAANMLRRLLPSRPKARSLRGLGNGAIAGAIQRR